MFNERKAAQVAAWFLKQSGGRMPHLKLIKLMYLAERESLRQHGEMITGDRFVAMEHGPVLSTTLDCINGYKRPSKGGWESWISDREDHAVELRDRGLVRGTLDEVSDAEVGVLEAVWAQFGTWDQWRLVDFLHDPKNCPEWTDPNGSSTPIAFSAVLQGVGYSPADAARLAGEIEEHNGIDRLFAAL